MNQRGQLWKSIFNAISVFILLVSWVGASPAQAQAEDPPAAPQGGGGCHPFPDALEPNDTLEQAPRVDANDSIHAQLCPGSENDYYAVDLTAGQELVVTLEYDTPYPWPTFEILNANGDTAVDPWWLWSDGIYVFSENGREYMSYSFTPQQSGRYYIHVYSWMSEFPIEYTLHLSTLCKGLFIEAQYSEDGNAVLTQPAGNCGKGPRVYQAGTQVRLQAVTGKDYQGTDYKFVRWNGDLSGSANPATVRMDRTQRIRALMTLSGPPFSCANAEGVSVSDCEALVSLFNAVDGKNWKNSEGWLYDPYVCRWYGVYCGKDYSLYLRGNKLKGSLPAKFYTLSGFPHIDLGENQLGPSLSDSFFKMPQLKTLRLDHNQFSGTLPTGMKTLPNLRTLDLSYNQLGGPLPLDGANWPALRSLNLAGNQFSGGIPSALRDHFWYLTSLDLSYNRLTGPIPTDLNQMFWLERFEAHHNRLSGPIPQEIGTMGHLAYLDLQSNLLSGPLPAVLGNLPLQVLQLSNNRLSGPIPPELFSENTQSLEVLELANNQLSGEIPWLFSMFPYLRQLRLDGNRLIAPDWYLRLFLAWQNPSWVSSQRVPMLQVSLNDLGISVWNFPVNTHLNVSIRDSGNALLYQTNTQTNSIGYAFLSSGDHQVALTPGMTVEVSDGVTVKQLTLEAVAVNQVNLPGQQVTGTAQPGTLVQVLADNLSQYDRVQVVADGGGSWDTQNYDWLHDWFGEWTEPTESLLLLPDTRVSARVYDDDGDVTYAEQIRCIPLQTAVSPASAGTVNAAPAPNCPGGYLQGTIVQLEAAPNPGFKFDYWRVAGYTNSDPQFQVQVNPNTLVTANFQEAVPPTVLKVNSFRPTADQQITPGEVITNLPITQLWVHFSEPMYNPSGDLLYPRDVTNPNAYRLTRSGQPVTVNLVVYDAANRAAKLLLNGGKALESGSYTLEILDGWLDDSQRNLFDGDSDGLPGGAYSLDFTLSNIPSAPKLVAPLSRAFLNDTTPAFEWTPGPTDKAYTLQIAHDSAFQSLVGTYAVASSTFTLPAEDALAEGRYFWRVYAVNPFDLPGKWSQVWNFTVDTTAPPAPLLRTPKQNTNTTDTTPLLAWMRSSGAQSYRLLLSDEPTFSRILLDTTTRKTSTVLSAANALPYGRYYWQVQAVDAAGNLSPWSDFFTFDISLLRSPQDGTYTTQTNPTLRWTRLKTASHYYLEVSRSPYFTAGNQVLFLTVPGTETRWVLGPLSHGWYYWRMSAVVEGVATPWMPAESFAVTPSLGRPKLTSPANNSIQPTRTVELVWQEAPWGGYQPPVYQVQVDDTSNFSSPLYDVTLGAGELSWVTPNLTNGKHYWRVRAVNGLGYAGPWSASGNFTVLAP